jgi:hypothetical protein
MVWGRNGIDMVKVDGQIYIIRSLVVRHTTCFDGTIFTMCSVFDTSLTRSTIN